MTAALLLAATVALRNPFWPIGYEGTREPISPEPRTAARTTAQTADDDATGASAAAAAAAALAAAKAQEARTDVNAILPHHWIAARKSLKIGGTVNVRNDHEHRTSVIINGFAYADGDLVSANHENRRFTWRVAGLKDGTTLKLIRVKARNLKTPEPATQKANIK